MDDLLLSITIEKGLLLRCKPACNQLRVLTHQALFLELLHILQAHLHLQLVRLLLGLR